MVNSYLSCLNEAKKHITASAEASDLVVVDAGADINPINHGALDNFTQMSIDIFGSGSIGHIYAFEPVNYQTYEETYKSNTKVTLIKKALSDTTEKQKFFVATSHGLSSLIHRPIFDIDGRVDDIVEVETTAIDVFMKEQNLDHIDYLKLDVEGGELKALLGAKKALENQQITFVQFEHGSTFGDAGYSYEDVDKLLQGFGYKEILRVGSEALYVVKTFLV